MSTAMSRASIDETRVKLAAGWRVCAGRSVCAAELLHAPFHDACGTRTGSMRANMVSSSASSAPTLQAGASRNADISAPADARCAVWREGLHLPGAKRRHVRGLRLSHSGVDYHEAALSCRAGKVGGEAQAVQHTARVRLQKRTGWARVLRSGKQAQRSTAQHQRPTLRQTCITSAWRALMLSFLPAA